jgi:hypothetical protein
LTLEEPDERYLTRTEIRVRLGITMKRGRIPVRGNRNSNELISLL